MLLDLNQVPTPAVYYAQLLRTAGASRTIIVGGWIRDYLLGRQSKDIDIEVYGLDLEQLYQTLLPFGAQIIGKSFAVVRCDDIDFSLPRTESKTTPGHKGFDITVNPTLSFAAASERRDFSINAIGFDLETKELIDCQAGLKDLNNQLLRPILGDITYQDDPLRILRGVRFAAQLNFHIESHSWKSSTSDHVPISKEEWGALSKERIRVELEKWFIAPYFSAGLTAFTTYNLEKQILSLAGLQQTCKPHTPQIRSLVDDKDVIPQRIALLATLAALDQETFCRGTYIEYLDCIQRHATNLAIQLGYECGFSTLAVKYAIRTIQTLSTVINTQYLSYSRIQGIAAKLLLTQSLSLDSTAAYLFDIIAVLMAQGHKKAHKHYESIVSIVAVCRHILDSDVKQWLLNGVSGTELIELGFKPGWLIGAVRKLTSEAIYSGRASTEDELKQLVYTLIGTITLE